MEKSLRQRSKQLVGGAYRLEVATAIAALRGESFSALEIADATGIRYPRVQEDLKRLLNAGLLSLQPRAGQAVEYKASPSIYWECCEKLVEELRASDAPSQ